MFLDVPASSCLCHTERPLTSPPARTHKHTHTLPVHTYPTIARRIKRAKKRSGGNAGSDNDSSDGDSDDGGSDMDGDGGSGSDSSASEEVGAGCGAAACLACTTYHEQVQTNVLVAAWLCKPQDMPGGAMASLQACLTFG